jgi:hypothetical protein
VIAFSSTISLWLGGFGAFGIAQLQKLNSVSTTPSPAVTSLLQSLQSNFYLASFLSYLLLFLA